MNFLISSQHMPSLQREAKINRTPRSNIQVHGEASKIKMIVLPESRVEKIFKNWIEFLGKMREKKKEKKRKDKRNKNDSDSKGNRKYLSL